MTSTINQLAAVLPALSISEVEHLLFNLSSQQRRLVVYLAERDEVDTLTIRDQCGINNISEIAKHANAKLAAAGIGKRISCDRRIHENAHGDRSRIGFWRIANTEE